MRALSEIFFLAIVFYLLYRFVFGFLIPVVRTTRQVRQQFRNMQDMSGSQGPFGGHDAAGSSGHGAASSSARSTVSGGAAPRSGAKPPADDYIDFEEIKD